MDTGVLSGSMGENTCHCSVEGLDEPAWKPEIGSLYKHKRTSEMVEVTLVDESIVYTDKVPHMVTGDFRLCFIPISELECLGVGDKVYTETGEVTIFDTGIPEEAPLSFWVKDTYGQRWIVDRQGEPKYGVGKSVRRTAARAKRLGGEK
jgi:hypothetical protein